jgi:hypothetical protein
MGSVFLVQHSREIAGCEDVKLIGAYSSRRDAEAAVSRLAQQSGFREHPTGFHIDEYEIGKDHWVEGFVSVATIMMPLLDEGVDVWRPVQAEVLPHGRYRIVSQNESPDDEQWAFKSGEVVRCEEREFNDGTTPVAVSLAGDAA